jgi:hypothetical protein
MIGELLELERLRDGRGIRTARQNVVSILEEIARNSLDRPPRVCVAWTTQEFLVDLDADRMRTVIRNFPEERHGGTTAVQNTPRVARGSW